MLLAAGEAQVVVKRRALEPVNKIKITLVVYNIVYNNINKNFIKYR
jgi:hypothetical protein